MRNVVSQVEFPYSSLDSTRPINGIGGARLIVFRLRATMSACAQMDTNELFTVVSMHDAGRQSGHWECLGLGGTLGPEA